MIIKVQITTTTINSLFLLNIIFINNKKNNIKISFKIDLNKSNKNNNKILIIFIFHYNLSIYFILFIKVIFNNIYKKKDKFHGNNRYKINKILVKLMPFLKINKFCKINL